MKEDLSNHRKIYQKSEINFEELKDPYNLFEQWFNIAKDDRLIEEVNAMVLSTVGNNEYPKGRVVLLKKITPNGFVFFSNYNSDKGISIEKNNKVSLLFFWPSQERQVMIKGNVIKTSSKMSDEYFSKRPFKSQISAIISNQSEIIDNYSKLKNDMELLAKKNKNKTLKRPKNWGGYIVNPFEFEFWQGRPDRLHQRVLFSFDKNKKWKFNILSP
tara:strand:+ start:1270 stop:1914 length:645 start_codon:yes stop_codon:yes gene_type:complete